MTGSLKQSTPARTVHQIVDKDGNPYEAAITSNLWVSSPGRFADPTDGNKVQAFITGKSYFSDLLNEIAAAKSQILICGWQVNWDALLLPGIRLYDALYQAASKNPNLRIYIMPWDDHEPVQTYDDQTANALRLINKNLGRKQIFVQLSAPFCTVNASYYSHHQKQVVIDRCIAYIGGIDLAYGRYCDETFNLRADADGRQGLNRYNPCVEHVGTMPMSLCADPDLLTGLRDTTGYQADLDPISGTSPKISSNAEKTAKSIQNGAWQAKYFQGDAVAATNSNRLARNSIDSTTLDASRQPRMPWHDVQCRIEGPAVSDLMRNFIDRWNTAAPENQRLPPPPAASTFKKSGTAHVQVLRSAPALHAATEYRNRRYKADAPLPLGTQTDIYDAMLRLIEKSRRFIYIENQFFVSSFGKEICPSILTPAALYIHHYKAFRQNWKAALAADFDEKATWKIPNKGSWRFKNHSNILTPPQNCIVRTLLERIKKSALSGSPFHVYITLPVHPEGLLCEASIVTQVHWTMQTISFGSNSLLNGIRRIIKAREYLKAKDENFERVFLDNNMEYESIDPEDCNEFVTLLNLRNWAKLGDHYVTEQIYVHSKIMIVDDLYTLIGSANINDRSLLGERDSELAVLIMDGEHSQADIHGNGNKATIRTFAHELRKELWHKHLATSKNQNTSSEFKQAIEQAGNPKSWRLIQQKASQNSEIYNALFDWIPKNQIQIEHERNKEVSILPTWNSSAASPMPDVWRLGNLSKPMPFQKEFWITKPNNIDFPTEPSGYICSLPIFWTKGENNRFDFPSALVAENSQHQNDDASHNI